MQWHASHIISCPVCLPRCNRQWQNEIKAVRPNSHTYCWSRVIYWYRNWTRGQQTLEHSCYFMKGLAVSHSRSAKLKRYLITPESKGPLWDTTTENTAMKYTFKWLCPDSPPWVTEPAAGQKSASKRLTTEPCSTCAASITFYIRWSWSLYDPGWQRCA